MEENKIRWKYFYGGLLLALVVLIALFYWLKVAYS
jgi:hypothetical protein